MAFIIEGPTTKVEWWPLPRDGEVVPDYPPQDLTPYLVVTEEPEPED